MRTPRVLTNRLLRKARSRRSIRSGVVLCIHTVEGLPEVPCPCPSPFLTTHRRGPSSAVVASPPGLPGRFARAEAVPDYGDDESPGPAPATELFTEKIRSIISRNQSPDIPFEQSVNPYRGCEHGCVYCYARPSHAYLDLSPGLDFEQKIFIKPEAAAVLRRELSKPGYRCRPITLGSNTDAWQPVERDLRHHAADPGSARRVPAPRQHHHQVGAGGAGPGPAAGPGAGQPGGRARQRHDAGRRAEAPPGAPHRGAAPPPRDDPPPERRRHSLRRAGRADDPRAQRPRTREHSGRPPRRRARATPATCCCACPTRSSRSSRSGSRPSTR